MIDTTYLCGLLGNADKVDTGQHFKLPFSWPTTVWVTHFDPVILRVQPSEPAGLLPRHSPIKLNPDTQRTHASQPTKATAPFACRNPPATRSTA